MRHRPVPLPLTGEGVFVQHKVAPDYFHIYFYLSEEMNPFYLYQKTGGGERGLQNNQI